MKFIVFLLVAFLLMFKTGLVESASDKSPKTGDNSERNGTQNLPAEHPSKNE